MSKLYDRYLRLKEVDSSKYYLFRSGLFYIFIDSDASKISSITTLKLSKLNDNIYKCGFPKNSLDKYLDIFKNLGIVVEVIERVDDIKNEDVIRKIRSIDIDSISYEDAYMLLRELKEYYE